MPENIDILYSVNVKEELAERDLPEGQYIYFRFNGDGNAALVRLMLNDDVILFENIPVENEEIFAEIEDELEVGDIIRWTILASTDGVAYAPFLLTLNSVSSLGRPYTVKLPKASDGSVVLAERHLDVV